MNIAAMNILVQVLWHVFWLGITFHMELLCHRVCVNLTLVDSAKHFPTVAVAQITLNIASTLPINNKSQLKKT